MTEEKRRPRGGGAVLLGGERHDPIEPNDPQPEITFDPAVLKTRHAELRWRLAAAADYGEALCANALSPCSRDLAWWICRISNHYANDTEAPLARIQRELTRAEHLWRACTEVEFLESGQWPVEVACDFSSGQ
jgi:hypothetical protein